MALNYSALQALLVDKCHQLNQQLSENYIPDYLDGMSQVISNYLAQNMELTVAWVAYTTTTPPTPDPMITFTAKVAPFQLGLNRALIQGMTDSTLIHSTLNAKYKSAVGSIMINSVQLNGAILTPIPLAPLAAKASIKFGDSSNSGEDALEKNMEVLAKSVVNGIVGPITVPLLSGTHGAYISSATSSIVGIL